MADNNNKLAELLSSVTDSAKAQYQNGAKYRNALVGLLQGDTSGASGLFGEVKQLFDPNYMRQIHSTAEQDGRDIALNANPMMGGMIKNSFGRFPENINDVEKLKNQLTRYLDKNNIPFAIENAGYAGNSKYITMGKNIDSFNAENQRLIDNFIHGNSSSTLPSRADADDYGLLQVRIADHPNKYYTDISIHPFEQNAYRQNDSYEDAVNKINDFMGNGGVKVKPEQIKTTPITFDNRQHLADTWVQNQKRNRPEGMSNKDWEKLGITSKDWDGWK